MRGLAFFSPSFPKETAPSTGEMLFAIAQEGLLEAVSSRALIFALEILEFPTPALLDAAERGKSCGIIGIGGMWGCGNSSGKVEQEQSKSP